MSVIVGAPTWHTGEDQERSGTEWDSVIYSDLPKMDLTGKKVCDTALNIVVLSLTSGACPDAAARHMGYLCTLQI